MNEALDVLTEAGIHVHFDILKPEAEHIAIENDRGFKVGDGNSDVIDADQTWHLHPPTPSRHFQLRV